MMPILLYMLGTLILLSGVKIKNGMIAHIEVKLTWIHGQVVMICVTIMFYIDA